jgi:hypothetical protein
MAVGVESKTTEEPFHRALVGPWKTHFFQVCHGGWGWHQGSVVDFS